MRGMPARMTRAMRVVASGRVVTAGVGLAAVELIRVGGPGVRSAFVGARA